MYRRQNSGFDRVPFAGVCEVTQGGTQRSAIVCNLSILGAYLHLESPPERNSEVELSFDLPDGGPPVRALATVTWVNDGPADDATGMPCGFGARFLAAAPEDVRRIANLVANFVAGPQEEYQVGVGMPQTGHTRVPFVTHGVFSGDEQEYPGSICNLSTVGAFLALEKIPRAGVRGQVRFAVPGIAGDFKVRARVAWRNPPQAKLMAALPPGCGLRFEELSPIDEAVLATVVQTYVAAVESERRPEEPGAG